MKKPRYILAIFMLSLIALVPVRNAWAGEGRVDTDGTIDIEVNFRYPPTATQITTVKEQVQRASAILCDATDGQMRIQNARLTGGGAREAKAEIWVYAEPGRSGLNFYYDGSNIVRSGQHITLFNEGVRGDIIAHELGHDILGLGDEYDEQSRWGGACGIGPGFDATSVINERNHSIMQQTGYQRCVNAAGSAVGAAACMNNASCAAGQTCRPVLMSEMTVDSNHDLLMGNNNGCGAGCMDPNCGANWNSTSMRYEQTQQSAIHGGDSDWGTAVTNYNQLSAPTGLPVETAPAVCDTLINWTDSVVGSDQVMLVVDRSGSMSSLVDPANATAGTRLDFAKAAAKAYVDLQSGRGVDVGLISFNDIPRVDRFFSVLNAGADADGLKGIINGLVAGGNTGIGTSLDTSSSEFQRVFAAGRNRTAFLLSDGQNTDGVDPLAAANRLRNIGVQVLTVPVGTEADRVTLTGIAGATGGAVLDSANGRELPMIYGELFARGRGEALLLPRTIVKTKGQEVVIKSLPSNRTVQAPRIISGIEFLPPSWWSLPIDIINPILLNPSEAFIDLNVESGAERLNIMLSALNTVVASWNQGFELKSPDGTLSYYDFSPGIVKSDALYKLIQIPNPAPGTWKLKLFSNNYSDQVSFVQAHVENSLPDCFADLSSPFVRVGEKVRISAGATFGAQLEGVTYTGSVQRPDGTVQTLTFTNDMLTRTDSAVFDGINQLGLYNFAVQCKATATAKVLKGEKVFPGPEASPFTVAPFTRTYQGMFYADLPSFPPCSNLDCDQDGIPNDVEGDRDLDNDRIPNLWDTDSDGDNIPDLVEGVVDTDSDGRPNYTDPDSDGDNVKDESEGTKDDDGDGIPNYVDNVVGLPDSDGDNIPDSVEGTGDPDGDGVPNDHDPDSDGDGISDLIEGTGDSDGDGIPNYLDNNQSTVADADKDGLVDSCDRTPNVVSAPGSGDNICPDVAPLGCSQVSVLSSLSGLDLSANEIKALSDKSLKLLRASIKKTNDPALKKRLAKSAAQVEGNLAMIYAESKVQLGQFPGVILKCQGVPACAQVDDTDEILQYRGAVAQMGNQALRALNRGTRLVYGLEVAKRKTAKLAKDIKAKTRSLKELSDLLPRIRSQCF